MACHLFEDWDGFSSYGDLNHEYDASPVDLEVLVLIIRL